MPDLLEHRLPLYYSEGILDQPLRVEILAIRNQLPLCLPPVMLELREGQLDRIELWAVANVVDALDLI